MTDKTDFSYLRALHFGGAEKAIAKGEFVSAGDLAEMIRSRGDVEIPDAVLDYICQHLAGEIDKPIGRPAANEIEQRKRDMFVTHEYQRLMKVLKVGELPDGDANIYGHEDADVRTDATPAERAARLVASFWLDGPESWRQVQNTSAKVRRS